MDMSTATPHPAEPHHARGSAMHRAWWSLGLIPVGLIAAFVVGEGIPALLGYDVASTTPPWSVMALALAGALIALALPLPVTWHFTRRAMAQGERGAKEPMIVAGAFVGIFLLVNLFSGLMRLLFE